MPFLALQASAIQAPALLALGIGFTLLLLLMGAAELGNAQTLYDLRRTSRRTLHGVSELLPWAALIAPGIVLNRDGALMAAWRLEGMDADAQSGEELSNRTAAINRALSQRDAGWMFHIDHIRLARTHEPAAGAFPSPVQQIMAESRRAAATAAGARFERETIVVATYLPPDEMQRKAEELFIQRPSTQPDVDLVLEAFHTGLTQVEDALMPIMKRLERLSSEAFVAHLGFCLNTEREHIRLGTTPIAIDELLATRELIGGTEPRIGDTYVRTVTIAGFPTESFPTMLDAVMTLPFPLRFSSRVIIEDHETVRKLLRARFSDWFGRTTSMASKLFQNAGARVNRDAVSMVDDLEDAQAIFDRGIATFAWYTGTIVLADPDPRVLTERVRETQKLLRQHGFPNRTETLLAIDTFLGTLPGDGYHGIRKHMLHSLTIGDLLGLSMPWNGRRQITCEYCPPTSPPLLEITTPDRQPFFLDLHEPASSVMHTLLVGPTGSGKTALLNLLASYFLHSPKDRVFAVDYHYGMDRTVRMLGGEHYDPLGRTQGMRLAPFRHIDDPSERIAVRDWLESVLTVNGVSAEPLDRERLDRALELLATLPAGERCFTTLLGKLSDPPGTISGALRQYCLGTPLGDLLDGTHDSVGNGRFQVFELSNVVQSHAAAVVPVLLWLFHRIERSLAPGTRTLIILDEAWLFLKHPTFAPRLLEWLKTLRKKHAGVVFATQELTDLWESALRDTILQSCKTKIVLPNDQALRGTRTLYEQLGLADFQIEGIAAATPRRHYWLHAADGCAMVDLALTPEELAVVGASSGEDLVLTHRLAAEYPKAWQAEIFRRRGLANAARRWEELSVSSVSHPHTIPLEIASV